MKTVKHIILKFAIFFRIIRKPYFLTESVSDMLVDEEIGENIIYVVKKAENKKWAIFRCPSKKEEIIYLCLMPNQSPRWDISIDFLGRPTIRPSIRQIKGSYAHFWVKSGEVWWCSDSGMKL